MARDIRQWTAPRRRRSIVLSALCAVGAAGLLAACGSTGGGTSSAAGSASTGATSTGSASTGAAGAVGGAAALSTRQVSGVGTVLVDQSGKTVYTSDQEAGGKILCTGGCLSFWFPVTAASSAAPSAPGGVTGTLNTIQRPDNGQMQVTYNGKPLYTFRLDQAPGDAHGANFQDSFGGTTFTWRAVDASGAQSGSGAGAPAPNPSGSLYGSGSLPGY